MSTIDLPLSLLGLWPSEETGVVNYLRKIIFFGSLIVTVIELYEPINFIATFGHEEDLSQAGNIFAVGLLVLVLAQTAYCKMDDMSDLLDGLEKMLVSDKLDKDETRNAIVEKCDIYMKTFSKFMMYNRVCMLCSMVLRDLKSYLDGNLSFR